MLKAKGIKDRLMYLRANIEYWCDMLGHWSGDHLDFLDVDALPDDQTLSIIALVVSLLSLFFKLGG